MKKSIIQFLTDKRSIIALANLAGMLLVGASIVISLQLARQQAIDKETAHLALLHQDVWERMHRTSAQFARVVDILAVSSPADACHADNIFRMQQIVIASPALQAIGYLHDHTFQCSSLSKLLDGVKLGSPNVSNEKGVNVWSDVELPNAPGQRYLILERKGVAAIMLPIENLDVLGSPDTAIAIYSLQTGAIYTSRGMIKPSWIKSYQGGARKTFIDEDGGYFVMMETDKKGASAMVTAVSAAEITRQVTTFAKLLIPLGLIPGIALAAICIMFAKRRYSSKTELSLALKRHEFFLEYQPIIDLRSKACVGAEALIRWRQADGTLIRPDLFIPLAEENGLICDITARVLELIAADMAELLTIYPDFHIGINLSSLDLQSEQTIPRLHAMVNRIGVGRGHFVVEATERGFLDDGVAQQLVSAIRALGMQVAIDDFGTGYSSLSYLTKFQLDYLKIDKTFVDAVGTDAATSHVAFHIIEMAKSLNLKMIAEGVETALQADILLARGVTHVQGWLFARSLSVSDLQAYMEAHPKPDQ